MRHDAAKDTPRFDPLLACLDYITTLFGMPFSSHGTIAGLPLDDNGRLTLKHFARAATRSGLTASVVRKKPTTVAPMIVPFIAILANGDAAVITSISKKSKSLKLVFPASSSITREVSFSWLEKRSTGHVVYVTREFVSNDATAKSSASTKKRHWFWSPMMSYAPSWMNIIIAALVVNVIGLATPLFIMNVYDRVVPNLAIPTLWALSAGVAIALLFDLILRQLRSVVLDWTGRRVDMSVASELFEHALSIKTGDRRITAGSLANNIREFEVIREFFTSSSLIALTDLLFISVFLAAIWFLVGPLCLVPIITVAIVLTISLIFQMPIGRSVEQSMTEASQRHSILVESLIGIESIKASGSEGSMQRKWEDAIAATARANSRSRFWSSWVTNLTTSVQQTSGIVVIVWGVFLIIDGSITIGALIATSILSGRALSPLSGIAATLARAHQAFAAMKDISTIMKLPSERATQARGGQELTSKDIQIEGLTFTYAGGHVEALKNINISIAHGERVGIVGRVGSGKSTFGKLLAGFYEPTEGNIRLGGLDLRSFNIADVRSAVGYVPQDPELFTGSIRDNIIMGRPETSSEDLMQTIQIAGIDRFIADNPEGLGLQVGERGRSLSGGQRQAVALARILLRDPDILFLDESSSAMDAMTEGNLGAALINWADAGKTLIVATHRGSMFTLVDRLIVIENGQVAADGPKDQVLQYLRQLGEQNKSGASVNRIGPA
jgi:ATP-binding cassette subfamily C protein LapB